MALLPETKKRGTGAREFVNNFRLYLTVFNSLICYRAIVCLYNIFYATQSIRRKFPIYLIEMVQNGTNSEQLLLKRCLRFRKSQNIALI